MYIKFSFLPANFKQTLSGRCLWNFLGTTTEILIASIANAKLFFVGPRHIRVPYF